MNEKTHPFVKLRRIIRQSATQFRRNNDNSESIFHPKNGFTYGYDIPEVEAALDEYEQTLPYEFKQERTELTLEEKIMKVGAEISVSHTSMDARDFARTVLAYMAMNSKPATRGALLTLLKSGPGEEDVLGGPSST